jgi:hypothetical protein
LNHTEEQKQQHLENIRKSKLEKYGDLNYNNHEQAVKTQIKNGRYCPKEVKPKFEVYRDLVWKFTRKYKTKLFEDWNGKDFYTGSIIANDGQTKNQVSIDHIFPIIKGFEFDIEPELIGHLSNLCICTKSSNSKKGVKIDESLCSDRLEWFDRFRSSEVFCR